MIQVNEQPAFECPKDKTVLEAMESNDLEVHFHCREGFCGACRTKLVDGEVDYTTDPLAFIDDDEILPCCCVPKSAIKLKQV
ncbi:Vanillate monooxygenase [Saliniradius amylolyticus]|uniref:Vanillate monooxygenase n=2 Tax=Saliniradius amylolyticus TaxID=2183582 RepID=A0A2S2E4Y1_9ALTE|nr:class I ribonucleotide reductase maintenance protein YfaE [Saliniradius amylolyticus]AWL12047.1 Vanillate monooxygenase [Saliniradius amylolyticus]